MKIIFVIANCIFSPTGWVRRRLSNKEYFDVLYLPEKVGQDLSPAQAQMFIQDTNLVPQRVYLRLLDGLVMVGSDSCPAISSEGLPAITIGVSKPSTASALPTSNDSSKEFSKELDMERRKASAAKNDDAPVPEYIWNDVIVPDGDPLKLKALSQIRSFALRWWMRHTTKDFLCWFRTKHRGFEVIDSEKDKDLKVGRECIYICCNASWWEWTAGSRPLFWRWPEEYKITLRDGLPPWVKGSLPLYKVPQRVEREEKVRKAIVEKLSKVRTKGYISPGEVRSLTSYFTVPKGDGDVRMVYDATKSGLNGQLWAPWFMLPTVESHLLSVETCSFMGDIDLSEQFLNIYVTRASPAICRS